MQLSFLLLHIHHQRTSFTISGRTTRAAIDFSSSSQLCPRANQDGPAPLRSLTLPHTSAVSASQSLSKSPYNRHTGPSLLHLRCDHVYTLMSSCSHQLGTRLMPVAFRMLLIHLSTSRPAACVAPYLFINPFSGHGLHRVEFCFVPPPCIDTSVWFPALSRSSRLLDVTALLLEKDGKL